ncbi:MAG: hypothetical protein ACRDB9_07595 [Cetobacterium sp.]
MAITDSIVNVVKEILRAIKEGFKTITIYTNSKGRKVLSIGSFNIPLLSDNEMRIALSLAIIIVTTVAGEGAPIGELKELEIIFYNIFVSSFINNTSSK